MLTIGTKWRALLKLVQDVSGAISITINTLLIFLIVTKSPKQIGPYKYLMIFISVFEIFYSILDIVLTPQHYSHGPAFLVIVDIENKMFNTPMLIFLLACYGGFFGASLAVFAVHFVYRWLVVSENPLLETFKGWKICIWLLFPLTYGLGWVLTGYFLVGPNETTTNFIRQQVKELFGMDEGEYVYLGPLLYERMTDGSVKVNMVHASVLAFILGTTLSSFIIVIVFGRLCYTRLTRRIEKSTVSIKSRKLQAHLFYALVIQTIIPFVLMHIPASILFLFVFLNIDLGVYSALVSMAIAVYPAADPIPTLLIIENYRNTLIGCLTCSKKRIEVTHTSHAYSSSSQPPSRKVLPASTSTTANQNRHQV